jgi:predicted nucleic acid-binding protein
MAVKLPVFLDTSVFVAGLIELGPASEPAERILSVVADGKIEEPLTAWHCCLEFYSVSTRLPEEFRVEPAEALQLLEENILRHFRVAQLPEREREGFLKASATERIAGGRIYDAHLGEIARISGARTVVSDNRPHFATLLRFGIRVLTASEYAAELGRVKE